MLTVSALTVTSAGADAYQPQYAPGHFPGQFDLSCHVGPLWKDRRDEPQWPMYSFDRPATMLWNAIGRELHAGGWSDKKIKEWLASKSPRHALDGSLGDTITDLGAAYAADILAGKQD